jgi:heat shock protein HslJ
MKKLYTTILILLLSYNINAQTDPDLLGQWFLHYMELNGSTINVPNGSTVPINFTSPGSFDSVSGDSTCNSFTAEYALSNSNSSIDITFTAQTLAMCYGDTFEPIYLAILGNDTTNFFDYTINLTDETLTMIDLLGKKLVYGRQVLSTEDNTILSNTLKVYPNPSKDKLFINGITIDATTSYTIYNLLGNIVNSKNILKENSLKVDFLKAGIYFLKITQKDKTYIKKFIKI